MPTRYPSLSSCIDHPIILMQRPNLLREFPPERRVVERALLRHNGSVELSNGKVAQGRADGKGAMLRDSTAT